MPARPARGRSAGGTLLAALGAALGAYVAARWGAAHAAPVAPVAPAGCVDDAEFVDDVASIARAYAAGSAQHMQELCVAKTGGKCASEYSAHVRPMEERYYASLMLQYNRAGGPCARRRLARDPGATRYWALLVRRYGGAVII